MSAKKQSLIVGLFLSGLLLYSGVSFSRSTEAGGGGTGTGGGTATTGTTADFSTLNDVNHITREPIAATTVITGNVLANDIGADHSVLISSVIGQYGSLALLSDGSYTYSLFNRNPEVANLNYDEFLTDTFVYNAVDSLDRVLQASLSITIFGIDVTDTGSDEDLSLFSALDDVNNVTRDPIAATSTVTGNVLSNDFDARGATLVSSVIGQYGRLAFSNGVYVYTLFNREPDVLNLDYNEFLTDTFVYQAEHGSGATLQAELVITIFGAYGVTSGNVEVEPNGRSNLANALNSGSDMRGHLRFNDEHDWFSIQSSGNEIIHLELCPAGTSCYDQKAWVMYVFDGSLLTTAEELATVDLVWQGDTSGNIYGTAASNQLYLNYRAHRFENSLVGIIDPCFGQTTSLDIGVGQGNRTYYVALSGTLKGDGGGDCGDGSIILERPGPTQTFQVTNADGSISTQTEATTEEFISFLRSEDQYQIVVSRTGVDPLLEGSVSTSILSDRNFTIPKIRLGDSVFSANFTMQENTSNDPIRLNLSEYTLLNDGTPSDAFIASYDVETGIVQVPKYRDSETQQLYKLVFSYDPSTTVLELITASPIE